MTPLARVVATAVAGVDPSVMGIGPVPATRKVLQRAGLTIDQIDLIELNEAFAAQGLACMKELQLDPAKVNVYGGAIAMGHALGSSGSRLLTTLVHALASPQGTLRPGDDVHRRRPGNRDDRGAGVRRASMSADR